MVVLKEREAANADKEVGPLSRADARVLIDALEAFKMADPRLTTHEIILLLHLYLRGSEDVSVGSVREEMGLGVSHFNKVQSSLEGGNIRNGEREAGLGAIRVDINPDNRRERILSLTAKGRKLVANVAAAVAAVGRR